MTQIYTILLSTVIRDFGLTKYKQMSKNLRDFEKAIQELKESNTIINFQSEAIKQTSPRVKILDYRISIQTHPKFISEVKKANYTKLLHDKSDYTTYSGNSDSVT